VYSTPLPKDSARGHAASSLIFFRRPSLLCKTAQRVIAALSTKPAGGAFYPQRAAAALVIFHQLDFAH